MKLTKEQEEHGFAALEHCATYLCAVQIHTVLETIHPDPFSISEPEIQVAFHIARLIRNSFAHNPFDPHWQFGTKYDNTKFEIPSLITIDTKGRNGQAVTRGDYGGPLAILRFVEYTQGVLEQAAT